MKKSAILILCVVFLALCGCGKTIAPPEAAEKPTVSTPAEPDGATAEAPAEETVPENTPEAEPESEPETEHETEPEPGDPYKLTETMAVSRSGGGDIILQQDTVNGITYALTLNLQAAGGFTTEEQLVICTRLFWECYPKLYERFRVEGTPTEVNLLVEDEGYEIACAWENNVHLHDRWLCNNPDDFDCLTHELAHVVQTGWDGDYCPAYGEDTYMIERFADYCRYTYAFCGGRYNDEAWVLRTPDEEGTYYESNRFWVWLDRTYSTDETDIMQRLARELQVRTDDHLSSEWESGGAMWDTVFAGTDACGKTLDELWAIYEATPFAWGAEWGSQ